MVWEAGGGVSPGYARMGADGLADEVSIVSILRQKHAAVHASCLMMLAGMAC